MLLAAVLALGGCGDDNTGGGGSGTTPTGIGGPEATATPTPLASAGVVLTLTNGGAATQQAMLSGTRLSGPADHRATSYGPLAQSVDGHGAATVGVPALAPGVWLHRIEVTATGQQQYRQALVVDDPATPNALAWTVFATVLSVNQAADTGDGDCDTTCTLRDAVTTANMAAAPVLIVFDHAQLGTPSQVFALDQRVFIQSAGLTIDGTDENGDPSPVVDFTQRTFPARITLRGTKQAQIGAPSGACPCTQDYGGTLFAGAPGVVFVGLHVDRTYPPQAEICCGDQTLIELGQGALNGRVDTCLLDGGGREITDAVTPMGRTGQATSKDCIKPERTGSTPAQPVVVTNSEISYCLDRGAKVADDFLLLSHNWIHNNLRCAMFAIVPQGSIEVEGNLIEENGMNCPRGAPPAAATRW
jgi:CSLREA domain-containing protein